MHPALVVRRQVRRDSGLVAGGMTFHFAASADALVRLDMRTGGYFLQENFDRFRALGALESEDASWFQHEGAGEWVSGHFIIRIALAMGRRSSAAAVKRGL